MNRENREFSIQGINHLALVCRRLWRMDAVSFEAHLSRYRVDVELKPEKRRDARCTDLE